MCLLHRWFATTVARHLQLCSVATQMQFLRFEMAESCYSLQVHVLFWVCACAKLQMLLVDNSLGELRILSFKHHCVEKYDPDVPKSFAI